MKLKELKRTVNVSWSPSEHHPAMVAAGSAAQQLDASFSSNSLLELYALNLEDPGLDFELKASIQTQHKFQKIVWSGAGIIVGGCDGGLLEFYSADKLLTNASDSLTGNSTKHNGHISALDINPYQKNLLASGASESEIFIWDLNNTSQPMAPGNRSQPHEQVQGLAWNQQVQHILGSTFSTRCLVWDLRKNEPIMKLSDSQSNIRWRSLAWHPEVATQLCIASEEDQSPVIQLWDLRLASSPLATLAGHSRGVTALSWSARAGLLLSAARDGRLLAWEPASGEPASEVGAQQGWVYEAALSPRVPALLLAAAADALALHCLLPVDRPDQTAASQSSIAEAFGGLALAQLPSVRREPAERRRHSAAQAQPARPPRYLARPARASFAYGGKLVTFESCPQEAGSQKLVYVSQVVTEPELVQRAAQLLAVLPPTPAHEPATAARLAEYCRARGDAAPAQSERYAWYFLRAHFLPDFTAEALNLLGFKQDEIPSKFKSLTAATEATQLDAALSRGESTETEAELSTDTSTDLSDAQTLIERRLADVEVAPAVADVAIPNGEDSSSVICRALVCGNLEEAVELCLEAKRVSDALIIASLGSAELLSKVQRYYLWQTAHDPVSLLAGSVLTASWERLVAGCAAASWRAALAALLALAGGDWQARCCEAAATPRKKKKEKWGTAAEAAVKKYADELAAQGALDAAAALLRAAACQDSALPPQQQPPQHGRNRTFSSQPHRVPPPHNDVANAYSSPPGLYDQSAWQQSSVPVANAFHQGFAPQAAQPTAVQPPPSQPPRPGSVGPHSGGLGARGKYRLDPSVQAAPRYDQYSFCSGPPDLHSSASVPNPAFNPAQQHDQPRQPSNLELSESTEPGAHQPGDRAKPGAEHYEHGVEPCQPGVEPGQPGGQRRVVRARSGSLRPGPPPPPPPAGTTRPCSRPNR
ncbi:hypothetical protein ACJJTC_013370, partial [Scirpophaga incertulas]